MKILFKKINIFLSVLTLIYLSGFILLYPLFAHFVSGSTYAEFIANPAYSIHKTIYAPTIKRLGKNSLYTKLWVSNSLWWCNKINSYESCNKNFNANK